MEDVDLGEIPAHSDTGIETSVSGITPAAQPPQLHHPAAQNQDDGG